MIPYENTTAIRFELEVAATKLISQYMINNEALQKELESGIKKAFEKFDFEAVVQAQVEESIKRAIKDSANWGSLYIAVKEKADAIVAEYANNQLEVLAKKLNS